ncbi:uncharacterized protein DUF349 [Kineococcus rhizosphaerae]|uniref:Uncharacterized protein DUF349 n=1 Tax=Kineococcus rhizosphaerae TaxID=559628 RepID=A0A2T0R9R8_9ACTN|nr:uncharacterized protein DUF349 [Kineococcus rhizosphaerae]
MRQVTEQPQEPASPQDVADTPQTPTPTEPVPVEDTPGTSAEAAPDVETDASGETPEPAPAQDGATPAPGPRPVPGPGAARPAPRPTPVPPPAAPALEPVAEVGHTTSVDRDAAAAFGRVDENGTVWVRRADGEHEVGAYPDATPEEAIAYFVRKFEEVVAQVDLFEQRLRSTELAGKDIVAGVATLRTALAETRAVGDLDHLAARVEALATVADEARAAADRARAAHREQLRTARLAIVEEAEAIAAQDPEKVQWRAAGERLRALFEDWKAAQREGRLDKRSEDDLWKRFSHARSAFDKSRRHHFAALGEQRTSIRSEKEALVAEAEALSTSTDWRGTTNAYRALMDRWKAAGRLGRKDDDALWERFRAAQDVFFAARTSANDAVDEEFRDNLVVKEQLLAEAEALLPIKDLNAAKKALNGIQDRWEAAGKVPRGDLGRVEGRLRAVETAVRDAEQARWSRSNPETQARAGGLAGQLESAIRDLEDDVEKARAKGDARALARAEEALAARRAWLDAAQATLREAR